MDRSLRQRAIEFWQDRLAKFFPQSKLPTGSEIAMFEAGYALSTEERAQAELEPLRAENERLHEEMLNVIVEHPTYKLSKQLEAENERLRDALAEYLARHDDWCATLIEPGKSCDCTLPNIARAALADR